MNNSAFQMLIACFGAAGCWALWFYFIKEYRVEVFRERLFSMRDELFSFAAGGEISFDHPAYQELRAFINGMIRFAHRVTFLTLLTTVRNRSSEVEAASPYTRWKNLLQGLPPETTKKLEQIHRSLFMAFMDQLVGGSIVLFPISRVLLLGFKIRASMKAFFSAQRIETNLKIAMEMDLARTLNVEVLEAEAYKAAKTSKDMNLSPA